MMNIVTDYPPNFELLSKTFGIPRETNIVFTYGNTLYIPSGAKPDKPLLRHEETHAKQQSAIGPAVWWDKFIQDKDFRLAQELEAYRIQYAAMFDLPARHRRAYLDHISNDLAGFMYGTLMSPEQAKELITGKPTWPISFSGSSEKARRAKKLARQNKKKGRK